MSSAPIFSYNNHAITILDCLTEHKIPKAIQPIVLNYWSSLEMPFKKLKWLALLFRDGASKGGALTNHKQTIDSWNSRLVQAEKSPNQQIDEIFQLFTRMQSLVTHELGSELDEVLVKHVKIWREDRMAGLREIPRGFVSTSLSLLSNRPKPSDESPSKGLPPLTVQSSGANVYFLLDGNFYHFSIRENRSNRPFSSKIVIENNASAPWYCIEEQLQKTAPPPLPAGSSFLLIGNLFPGDSECHSGHFTPIPAIQEHLIQQNQTPGVAPTAASAATAASSSSSNAPSPQKPKRKTDAPQEPSINSTTATAFSSEPSAKRQKTDATAVSSSTSVTQS